MFQERKMAVAIAVGLFAGLFVLATAAPAGAAKWWNPLTWFEDSEKVKAETAKYKAERPQYVSTLDEAKQTGDAQTIRKARAELREFDKAHEKRVRELRKETHQQMRLAHKDAHKAEKDERKAMKAESKSQTPFDKFMKALGLRRAEGKADAHAQRGFETSRTSKEKKIFDDDEDGIGNHVIERDRANGHGFGGGRGKGR